MSLINDALKRAGQKREAKHDFTNMKPVMKQSGGSGGGPGLTIIVICLVICGAITLGIWSYWNKKYKDGYHADKQATNAPAATAAPAAATNAPATNNNVLARAARTLGVVKDRNDEGTAAAETMQKRPEPLAVVRPPQAQPQAAGAAKKPEDPKLQAIFYRLNDPTALIDGKTVGPGAPIAGGRVIAITREFVQVEIGGEVKELRIKKK